MSFLYMLKAMCAAGYKVEQIALRRVVFRSLNGFYRHEFKLAQHGWVYGR